MDANQAIAQSFRSQFIPQIAYSFVLDRPIGNDNNINWQFTVQEAGGITDLIYKAAGKKGEKKLFGTPFSQFIKGQTQLVYNRRLYGDHWLVSRVAVGAAHAYGNSKAVPYSEQFYVGGANSIRAFTVRSIGPGSYQVPKISSTAILTRPEHSNSSSTSNTASPSTDRSTEQYSSTRATSGCSATIPCVREENSAAPHSSRISPLKHRSRTQTRHRNARRARRPRHRNTPPLRHRTTRILQHEIVRQLARVPPRHRIPVLTPTRAIRNFCLSIHVLHIHQSIHISHSQKSAPNDL